MENGNCKISSAQFLFSVACYFQSTTLLTSFIVKISRQNSWLCVIIGIFAVVLFYLMMLKIFKNYPGKSLIQINEIVFGKAFGKIISCLYLFFFLSLTSLNFIDVSDFLTITIMHKTPPIVIMIIFGALVVWAVKSGLNAATRLNTAFCLIISFLIVFDTALVYKFVKLDNILPVFDISANAIIQGTHIITTIPYGEIIVISMLVPFVNASHKVLKRNFFIGFTLGVVSILIVVLREIFVLGDMLELFNLPSFQTLRLINLGAAISRIELLLVLVLMILSFSKAVILFFATAMAFSQIFNLKSYKSICLPLLLIAIIYALNIFSSKIVHGQMGADTTPFVWTIFEYILPLITFIVIQVRQMFKQKAAKAAL